MIGNSVSKAFAFYPVTTFVSKLVGSTSDLIYSVNNSLIATDLQMT